MEFCWLLTALANRMPQNRNSAHNFYVPFRPMAIPRRTFRPAPNKNPAPPVWVCPASSRSPPAVSYKKRLRHSWSTDSLFSSMSDLSGLNFDDVADGLDFSPSDEGNSLSPIEQADDLHVSADSQEEDTAPQKQKKKRVRTTTVSQACTTCRKRVRRLFIRQLRCYSILSTGFPLTLSGFDLQHAKCDGNQPRCAPCASKGLDCIWETKRAKRGPHKGTLTPAAHDGNMSLFPDAY